MWFGQVVDGQDTHECGRREGEKTERGDEKTERKPDAPRGGAEWEDGPPREKYGRNFLTDGDGEHTTEEDAQGNTDG